MKILNRLTDELVLEIDSLRGADLSHANLSFTDLSYANLRWVNLMGADLRDADLRWVNLMGANLRGANLRDADLRWVNLMGANLMGANLRGADLSYANLRETTLWHITRKVSSLTIGCQEHTIEEWKAFSDKEISKMHPLALIWWKQNKSIILGENNEHL